jgi:hypothetical protein
VLRLATGLATLFAVREQSFRQTFHELLSNDSACMPLFLVRILYGEPYAICILDNSEASAA